MASLLAGIGTAASSIGSSGLGSVFSNALGGSGTLGGTLGSLIGSSIQNDAMHDLGGTGLTGVGATGFSDLLGLSGNQTGQTGQAAMAQQAYAPDSLGQNPQVKTFQPGSVGVSPFAQLIFGKTSIGQ